MKLLMPKSNKVFVLFGMTGAGKSAIAEVVSKHTGLKRIKNTTTRPQRNDSDNEYNFTTTDSFLRDDGRYIAVRKYHTFIEDTPRDHYYGVDKIELENGGLLITDFEGLKELVERKTDLVAIYVYSNKDTRLDRAKKRDGFKLDEFERRNEDDLERFNLQEIINLGKDIPLYLIDNSINGELNSVCDRVEVIIKHHI